MNIYSFPAIVAFVINFTVAFAVFFGNTRSPANRWISAFILGLAVWNLSEIFVLASGEQQGAALAAQVLYRIVFITPAIYVIASYHFPQTVSGVTSNGLFQLGVLLLPVILLMLSFPHFHIKLIPLSGSRAFYYRIVIRPDFQSISLVSTLFAYLLWGLIVMIRKIPTLRTTTQRGRARLFLSGGVIYLLCSLLLFIVATFTQNTALVYIVSTVLSFVVSGFFAMAVLKGHMFNSPRPMRSSLAYSIASSIILAVYFLSVQAVTQGLMNYFQIGSYGANALFVLALVLLIHPLERRIHGTLDRLLSRDVSRHRHDMVAFSRELSNYLPVGELFRRVEIFLSHQFQIEQVIVLIRNEKPFDHSSAQPFTDWKQQPDSLRIEPNCHLVHELLKTKRSVEFYDIKRDKHHRNICSQLESKSIRILLPLLAEDELIGILALGVKKSARELTAEMLDTLTIFANEVATAYQRNSTIEQMREKERQQFRTQHLASLAQLIAGVAHEIRNPLGVISTSAQTLLKRKLPTKEEHELKEFIVVEADRLNKILTDFLGLAKLRTPKFESVSLEELFQRLQTALGPSANGIEIRVSNAGAVSEVLTDRELLYQLLFNLGINAVDAVKERCKSDPEFSCSKGRVTIGSSVQDGRLNISMSDNGTGIPEEHLQKVFDPFYTTKEAGTGLGLSISHNIAETIGGHLQASSRRGETIFTFTSEMKKEQG